MKDLVELEGKRFGRSRAALFSPVRTIADRHYGRRTSGYTRSLAGRMFDAAANAAHGGLGVVWHIRWTRPLRMIGTAP